MKRRILSSLTLGLLAAAPLAAQQIDPSLYEQLRYRYIGPDGNRAIAAVSEPANPQLMYIGAASGGIFKTVDGGVSWESIFDDHQVSSVGSLAMDPTDADVLWAGTGETFVIRPAHSVGNGIYKTTDAGETWTRMGLENTGRIGRVVIHPTNPDIVFACALGHTYGPQAERGIHRTTDGGRTWRQVLAVNDSTGCAELAIDPNDPDVLFAGMWQVMINTWGLNSGGTGGGVYVSRDGGDTWSKPTNGLPEYAVGKTAVAVAPSDSRRVYALIEEADPSFYRSDDGGRTWALVSRDHDMAERAPYYTRFAVDPADPDRIYFASVRFAMSVDGGHTLVDRPPRGGGDTHDIWIDPTDPRRFMVADDAGATLTMNHGETFRRIVLPIAQMYHVYTDNRVPYFVYGNRQDGYSYRGPSNSLTGGAIPLGEWRGFGGCESGFGIPDPVDDNIVWSGCYDGGLERYDLRTGQVRNVRVWPEAGYGWAPKDLRYRWHWTFPLAISPHDHNTVYVGSQYVHRTTNGGSSWEVISPDLTLDIESHQGSSGGVATDNLMTFDGSVLFAIAESPLEKGLIWVGSNDGQVHLTRDGGERWTNLTANVPDLPPWGTISNIEPSQHTVGTAYMSVDLHQMGDFDPYLYKTTDYGQSWQRIDADIPRSILSFTHILREDPVRPGMLYAGTDNPVYFSLDDGTNWLPLQSGLPPAPVYWLTVQPHFNDLVVATYGRGFYVLDDITPLRALQPEVLAKPVHLFTPRPAYRFQSIEGIKTEASNVTGRNPPYGAALNFYLPTAGAEGERVAITILNAAGDTVRSLSAPARAGINRLWWDLRHEAPRKPRLLTPPPGREWVPLNDEGWRPLVTWDLDLMGGQVGPLAAPGRYTVKLSARGQETTQPLTVLKDPNSEGTEATIAEQLQVTLALRDAIDEVAAMIDSLEVVKRDVALRSEGLDPGRQRELVAAVAELQAQLLGLEAELFDVHLTGAREDAFRNPMKLYGRLSALASDLSANGADFPPTRQQVEVWEQFSEQLAGHRRRFDQLMDEEVPAVTGRLQRNVVSPIR